MSEADGVYESKIDSLFRQKPTVILSHETILNDCDLLSEVFE